MIIVPLPPEAVKEVVKETTGLITKFLGPGFEEAGQIVADHVRLFRLQRELALLRRAEKIVTDAGFNPKAVNMKVLFPLLDAAVLEDNEDMSERWASLLASASNPNNQSDLEASFVEILKQIAPAHAYLLDVFYERVKRQEFSPEQWDENGFALSAYKAFLKDKVPQFDVALENLLRLNLVAYPTAKLGIANGRAVRIQVTSGDILCATSLGYAFASACGHGRTPSNISYGVPINSISNVFWTRGGSLNISPEPSPQLIPPGPISEEQQIKIQFEAIEIAKQCGCLKPGAGLIGRRLTIHVGKNELPIEKIGPLMEFCGDRGLQLEVYRA